jgi:uncharacterized protein YkwD
VRRAPRSLRIVLALLLGAVPASAGNGDPVDGHPNYRERALLALTNACRQDPQEYRDTYLRGTGILRARNYPPVPPLYASPALGRSARAHSLDMARTPCFQHDSCDGTSLWTRIRGYYREGTSMAENIAFGHPTPLEAINGWLLDGGAPDHSRGDGHRRNLLSAKFREMGNGSARGGRRGTYDTQDFGNGAPDFQTPLVSGSHVLGGDGTITFLASFYTRDGEEPDEAWLELEGRKLALELAFGKKRNGTYRVVIDRSDRCRRYRFRFRDDDGHEWLFPEGGSLFTTGEGGCTREYEPIRGG